MFAFLNRSFVTCGERSGVASDFPSIEIFTEPIFAPLSESAQQMIASASFTECWEVPVTSMKMFFVSGEIFTCSEVIIGGNATTVPFESAISG
ncbi:Uncharacterised protein [uncultured archaeon]|nr:Uncharacterised protein [uncultured archaeon]